MKKAKKKSRSEADDQARETKSSDHGDHRFEDVGLDPKFSRSSKRKGKVKVDERFKHMFTDEAFSETTSAKVDKYGRAIESNGGESDLKRLYDVEEHDDETVEVPKKQSKSGSDRKKDKISRMEYLELAARGEIEMEESSDEEDDSDDETIENDEAQSSSETESIPTGESTSRLAVQNLDWSHVSAQDIIAVLQSFLPTGGKVSKVTVYQSEFGEKEMKAEELHGPRLERFMKTKGNKLRSESVDDFDNEGDDALTRGDEIDTEALRRYEKSKLKYYFAIAEFDSVQTADKIYAECDGVEFLHTSLVFDLRFVPDDVIIERPIRDETSAMSEDYEAPEFFSKALQSTSVELTWDEDDPKTRKLREWKEGSNVKGKKMIGERDLEAFIASDVDSDSDLDESDNVEKNSMTKMKWREALLGNSAPVDTNGADCFDEDSFKEMKYIPEVEERQNTVLNASHKKGRDETNKKGRIANVDVDKEKIAKERFSDPFFRDPGKEKKKRRNRGTNGDNRETEEDVKDRRKRDEANLELLLINERSKPNTKEKDGLESFDFKTIELGEKLLDAGTKIRGRTSRKKKLKEALDVAKQDSFEIDTNDSRFKSFVEDPDYSVDRTSSLYKSTRGMKVMEKKQLKSRHEAKERRSKTGKADGKPDSGVDLQSMVESFKRKSQRIA